MPFGFYPRHEYNCPNVIHCSHLGGSALRTLVLTANEQDLSRRALYATIDAERARGDRLSVETKRLQKELERQNKFATNEQKQKSGDTADAAVDSAAASTTEKKKQRAPVGHPGWSRKTPTTYDWAVDVAAPK